MGRRAVVGLPVTTVAATNAPARASAPNTLPARIAGDPICGTVAAVDGTPSVEDEGETIYFCSEGCKSKFEPQHAVA